LPYGRWQAYATKNNKYYSLGTYETPEEAVEAARKFKESE